MLATIVTAIGKAIYVIGSEKREHFTQIPNFGFKTLISLKL